MTPKNILVLIFFLLTFSQLFAQAPVITNPADQTVNEGQTATFSVTRISGTEPFSYQWQISLSGTGSDWADISAANSSSLIIDPTTIEMDGRGFRCVVSNDSGAVNSSLAMLTVNALPPQITSQPTDQSVYVGETATFSLSATSSIAVSYQWYANGEAIPGATSASYTTDPIPDLSPDGTVIYCIVSNSSGDVESDNAILNVSVAPGRTTDGLLVLYNFQEGEGNIINDVSGVGSPLDLTISNPSAVNWSENGLDIINSGSITSGTPATKIIDSCKVTNELTVEAWIRAADVVQGEKTARIITLAENSDDRNFVVAQTDDIVNIATRTSNTDNGGHPGSWADDGFETSLMHLVYTRASNGDNRLYINGDLFTSNNINGDFSNWNSSYILGLGNEIQDTRKSWEGSFYLVAIYNKALEEFEISHNFDEGIPLNVESPTIIMNPRYQGALVGETIEFRVGAVGKLPMTYQWQVDEGAGFTNISGATKSFYRTAPVTTSDNKNDYRCIITNSLGSVTSHFATLYVTPNSSKVTVNKQIEYNFQEGSGSVINDVSGLGDPLNLTIQSLNDVEWTPYGLDIKGPAEIKSSNPASKLIDASINSHEFSFEAWIKPSEASLTNLSRLVAISGSASSRNFFFAQNNDSYEMRVRTTINISGSQTINSEAGTVNSELMHVAFTVNEFGMRKLFINGEQVSSNHNYGDITNWDNTFLLALGADVDNSYSWSGLFNYMAFYGRGLSPTEIYHNYSFGVEGGIPTVNDPTQLVLEANASNSIALSWIDNSDNESGFIIERSVMDSVSYVRIDSVAQNMTEFTDSTISESMQYYYRVKAYNAAAQSEASNQIMVNSLLNTPTNLTAQAQVFGEIILRWDENSSAEEGIIIERGEGDPIVFSVIDTVESNVNSYFDQSVGDFINYTYRVFVFNSTTNSEYSNTINVTSLYADINAPSNLTIELHSEYGIPVLSWVDESNNETGFIIERKIAGAEYAVLDTIAADTNEYSDNLVEENTIYLYRIMAFNDNTVSGYSNVADISVLTSVANLELPDEFSFSQNYPNPFNPTTNIQFGIPEVSEVSINVYNMLGEVVAELVNSKYSPGYHSISFNAQNFPSGVYVYSIKANGISGKSYVQTRKMLLLK